jgi:DNA-binding MarR family transcriptional regulator
LTRSDPLIDLSFRAARWLEEGLLARLVAAGWTDVTRAHSRVFANLDRDGTRPSELARRMGVTRQAAHQTVQELVDRGFLELGPDPKNARARRAVLTARGRHVVADARDIVRDLENTLERRIGRKRVARLRRALESDWGAPVAEASKTQRL